MPGSKEPLVIDGLSSVRAARRAGAAGRGRSFRSRPSRNKPQQRKRTPSAQASGSTSASRIRQTAVPVKHELLCYECGYAFVIRGVIHNTICPKCHRKLLMDDVSIDSEWTGNVKTVGNVEVRKNGVIKSGSITARDIVLEGNAEQAVLYVGRRLELCRGALFDLEKTTFKDLKVSSGASITIRRKLTCRDLDVEGELKASVHSDGVVCIRTGGLLRGSVKAPRLVVEEGGGLKARLKVNGEPPVR